MTSVPPDISLQALAWCFALALVGMFSWRRRVLGKRVDRTAQNVVIAGAANGMGRATCEALLTDFDDMVFALDVDQPALDALMAWADSRSVAANLVCIKCDVTDDASVASAVTLVTARLAMVSQADSTRRAQHIHSIINFAGVYACGPLLEQPVLEETERCLQINVIGTMRVNQAFHHLLPQTWPSDEAARRSSHAGTIVVVGSETIEARFAAGLTGPYLMSKYAIDTYADCLRQELQSMLDPTPPIQVSKVVFGPVGTSVVTEQPAARAQALVRGGSRWWAALLRFVATVEVYNQTYSMPAKTAGEHLARVVHAVQKPRHVVFNMSLPMRFLSCLPQALRQQLLDVSARRRQLGPRVLLGCFSSDNPAWTMRQQELLQKHL